MRKNGEKPPPSHHKTPHERGPAQRRLAGCRRPPVRGRGARLAAELLLCLHLRRQLRPQAVQLRMVGMGRGGTVPWGAWVPHGWRGQGLGFCWDSGAQKKIPNHRAHIRPGVFRSPVRSFEIGSAPKLCGKSLPQMFAEIKQQKKRDEGFLYCYCSS